MRARVEECQPGDKFVTPRGAVMYQQPALLLPGNKAFALVVKGHAIAVVIFRPGETTLRYCDPAGEVHNETMQPGAPHQQMIAAMTRTAVVMRKFLGERHPLAEAASANAVPA